MECTIENAAERRDRVRLSGKESEIENETEEKDAERKR